MFFSSQTNATCFVREVLGAMQNIGSQVSDELLEDAKNVAKAQKLLGTAKTIFASAGGLKFLN